MRFIEKLERKYSKFAIHNITYYIVFGIAAVFVLGLMSKDLYRLLEFDRSLILQGQVWRLLTFTLVAPISANPIFIIFALLLYFTIGNSLEQTWGAFKFNLYILIGALATLIVGFVFNLGIDASYIYTSVFLAFATVYPEFTVRIYFILPVKMKWLGWISGGFLIFAFIFSGVFTKLVIGAGIINYLVFFWPNILVFIKRNTTGRAKKQAYKKNFPAKGQVIKVGFHKCSVCGKTEVNHPELEFRYCSKCSELKEYCSDHLFDHEHQ